MMRGMFKVILLVTQLSDVKRLHYRMVNINGEKGCVQGVIYDHMASRFMATQGSCQDVNCIHYRGKTIIPFCCEITGYSCNEYIYNEADSTELCPTPSL